MSTIMETKKEDMEKVVVGKGSTFQLEVEVELPGTAIRSVSLPADTSPMGFPHLHFH